MSKLILVSFADHRYINSLKRLEKQTEGYPFDERYFLTDKTSFTKEYWRKLKPWFYRRGYGYWNWKFKIVKFYLDKLEYGDKLYYSDAGLTWNNSDKAIRRFQEQIDSMVDDINILVYNQPMIEQEWTKGDVLNALGVYDNYSICLSRQIFSGFFCLRKTPEVESLLNDIIDLSEIGKELITDKRSSIPNKPGFQEHRHDQSLFSVLVKKHIHIEIPYGNGMYEIDNNGDEIIDSPILIKRYKENERPLFLKLKNKILWPWRLFLHLYFKYYRSYDYNGHYSW